MNNENEMPQSASLSKHTATPQAPNGNHSHMYCQLM